MVIYSFPFTLPGCNEYINKCRAHRNAGAGHKKKIERDLMKHIRAQGVIHVEDYPVFVDFVWKEKNARRDIDNIAFDKKFILDSLVKCGVIDDDKRKYVRGFSDGFPDINKMDIGIDVYILTREEYYCYGDYISKEREWWRKDWESTEEE